MQTEKAFPHLILWQQLDLDGLDACIVDQFADGIRYAKTVVFLGIGDPRS